MENTPPSAGPPLDPRPCPLCHAPNPDWMTHCFHCGASLPHREQAIQSEIGHISYLLWQFPWWRARNLMPPDIEAKLLAEYASRQSQLRALTAIVPTSDDSVSSFDPPIVPELSFTPIVGSAVEHFSRPPQSPSRTEFDHTAPSLSAPPALAEPTRRPALPPRSPGAPAGWAVFLQEHALKIVFALATLLVLIALRSILGWNESNAVFLRLLPLLPLGLTAMFGQFGRRTQMENPWAAFVYHGLTAIFVSFDLFIINRFWLAAIGLSIAPKLLLLAACAASTATCGLLWGRNRYPAMWHLWQAGLLATLYAGLQGIKSYVWHQSDWRPTPPLLFGMVFLGVGAVYFGSAIRNRALTSDEDTGHMTPRHPAGMLWANLSITIGFALSALGGEWDRGLRPDDLLFVALLAGTLYGVIAQALGDARLVYVAAALCLGSGLLWNSAHSALGAAAYGVLFLAISTVALSLHTFNRRLASRLLLTQAWKRVALVGSTLGLLTTGGQALLALASLTPPQDSGATVLRTALAMVCGLQFLYAAVQESEASLCYPAFLAGGIALLGLLQYRNAAVDQFPLAGVFYAACLLLPSFRRNLPGPAGGSQVDPKQSLADAARLCGRIALGVSLTASALLAAAYGHSVWILTSLLLTAMLSALLGSHARASGWRYAALFSAACTAVLITQRLTPVPAPFPDAMLPFVLVGAAGAFAVSLVRPAGHLNPSSWYHEQRELWREPLVDAVLLALGATLLTGWAAMTQRIPQPNLALNAGICIVAAVLLAAARLSGSNDGRRIGALALLQVATALCLATATGLAGTPHPIDFLVWQRFVCGLLVQSWGYWLLSRAFWAFTTGHRVSEDLARIAMAPAVLTGILTAAGLFVWPSHASAGQIAPQIVIGGAFLLLHLEILRSKQPTLLVCSVALLSLAGLCAVVSPQGIASYPALTLAAGSVLATGSYLQLAGRLRDEAIAWLSGAPLLGGVTLALFQYGTRSLLPQDIALANAVWVAGGVGLSWSYLSTAKWSGRTAFVHLSGIALIGAYLRAVTWAFPLSTAWIALLLLPLFVTMAALSVRPPKGWEPLRNSYLEVATAASVPALMWTTLCGEGRLWFSAAPAQDLVTLSLAAYGLAYLCLAAVRKRPRPLTAAAIVLTLSYLNLLLSKTPALSDSAATLTWPLASFLFIQAALVWIGIGVLLKTRLRNPALARPVLEVAQCIALSSAVGAILSLNAPHQGSVGILTLAWASGIWFGLWALDQGESCLHIGAGNLLVGWCVTVYHTLGAEMNLLDIYLLPFGLYLLVIGHQVSRKHKSEWAQTYWGIGLLITLAPALLTRWMQAPGWHTALLLAECVVCVLWGAAQRIRAFVAAGLGTIILYAASVTLGTLPDTVTTVLALLVGVGLFVFGFYALTHREQIKRMAAALQQRWVVWHSWR